MHWHYNYSENGMTTFSLPILSLLFLAQVAFLGTLVLLIHRLSTRISLTPLMVLIGALTAVMQLRVLGFVDVSIGGLEISLAQDPFLILPVLMLALLVIYIVNGTQQARIALGSVLLVTLVFAFIQLVPDMQVLSLGGEFSTFRPLTQPPRSMLASALTMVADLMVMIVIYQAICNLRNRYPSRGAALLALMAALWMDAFLFPLLSSSALQGVSYALVFNVAGKTLAVLVIWPLLTTYIWYITPLYPETSASIPRPSLDLFTTTKRLEARAHFHQSLLRTLSQVSQLIVHTTEAQTLLDQACRLLIENRQYALVWIGLVKKTQEEADPEIKLVTSAGREKDFLDSLQALSNISPGGYNPVNVVLQSGQYLLERDIAQHSEHVPWRINALKHNLRASASLPMRQAGQSLGVISVYAAWPDAFDREELELLQELADDLAHALISLEARQQQAILHTAAETMQDGLFITNLEGHILYANPAIASQFNTSAHSLEGTDIRDVFSFDEQDEPFNNLLDTLREVEKADFELEQTLPNRLTTHYSIRASLATNANAQPAYIIINVRDTTRHHQFERKLISLNRFTTELVQTRDIQSLLDRLFSASEELLQADSSGFYPLEGSMQSHSSDKANAITLDEDITLGTLLDALTGTRSYISRHPVFVSDALTEPGYAEHLEFLVKAGVRALLLLPVGLHNRPIGALVLYYAQPRKFSDEDIQLGLTLAYTLAISLENTRLYQSEKSQREFADALAQGAAALNRSLEFDRVLDLILDQAIHAIQCRSVNIMLIEGDMARVVRHRDRTDPDERLRPVTGTLMHLTLPTFNEMLAHGEPLVIPNTRHDALWRQFDHTAWIASYAATPLHVQEHIIGFLNMNSDQVDFFTGAIIPRLEAFANTAAAAIQNARLYESTQEYAADLEDRVQERTQEVHAAKERIEHILASVPDAIFVLDKDNQLVQANPAGEELVLSAKEQGANIFSEEFVHNLTEQNTKAEKAVLQIGLRAYQALASSLDVDDRKTGTVVVFRDVTRFRELDEMKTQFISDVSHELRTPLTNLALYLDLLSKVGDPERSQRYMETLRREMQRLTVLIEDLLTISRLEAGRIEIYIEPVDVNRVVGDLALDRKQMAANQELTLTYDIEPDLPPAQADARLLSQVLSNLLTNALNYTPPKKSIHMQTSTEKLDGVPWIKISVQDTGMGISAEEMTQLFTRFFRGSASQATNAPGTGLGLAISKEIIDRLDGRISVESKLNEGSTFTVWLRAV